MLKRKIICDLDGTLCDDRHRRSYARERDWEMYHSLCVLDPPVEAVRDLLEALQHQKYSLYFCTGRTDRWRDATLRWMKRNLRVPITALLMRPEGDTRSATVVKPELIAATDSLSPANVLFVLEDQPALVAMWRGLGYECLLCGDFNS